MCVGGDEDAGGGIEGTEGLKDGEDGPPAKRLGRKVRLSLKSGAGGIFTSFYASSLYEEFEAGSAGGASVVLGPTRDLQTS